MYINIYNMYIYVHGYKFSSRRIHVYISYHGCLSATKVLGHFYTTIIGQKKLLMLYIYI